jgi:hypothetical protein
MNSLKHAGRFMKLKTLSSCCQDSRVLEFKLCDCCDISRTRMASCRLDTCPTHVRTLDCVRGARMTTVHDSFGDRPIKAPLVSVSGKPPMPTATTTMTTLSTSDILSHKPSSKGSPSTEATLQSLYNRAARAFLHRDVAITFTLLNAAFALIPPPLAPSPDPLDVHRRKWDILRITLETTVFSSTPDLVDLPQPLRESLLLSPQLFISTLYARSLTLFTPSSLYRKPSSAFLPHQVLITLVASSIKIDCPIVGREITEDWLSKRGQYDFVPSTGEPYHKVLELYCLHVLPRLGEWEYVKEFLSYENELSADKRRVSLIS